MQKVVGTTSVVPEKTRDNSSNLLLNDAVCYPSGMEIARKNWRIEADSRRTQLNLEIGKCGRV